MKPSVANGHHAVGEKFAVAGDFLAAFNLQPISDSVYRKSHSPGNQIYKKMYYSEPQRFVKIGISLVEFYVLMFSAYGRHPCERILA